MTLSTPVKIVALAALALALGLGGVALLFGHRSSPAVAAPPVPRPVAHVVHIAPKPTPVAKPKPHVQIAAGTPAPVAALLQRSPKAIVAVVYSSRVPGDRAVVAEARAGARTAHVPTVLLDVARPKIAELLAVSSWGHAMAPAVFVIRRPGRVVFTISGPTDRTTVAQAALTSR
jgi:hypothetical protein